MMSRMRFLPQLIDTLEKRIEQDKELLKEIKIRAFLDGKKTTRMKNKEKLISTRILRNQDALQKLHIEEVNIARQLNNMIII